MFWGLGAVGGAGGLTVVTTAPPPPARLAGLRTVIAFGGRGALATRFRKLLRRPLSDTPILATPSSAPPCRGRTPDTSKGDDSPGLGPPSLAGGPDDILSGSWGWL